MFTFNVLEEVSLGSLGTFQHTPLCIPFLGTSMQDDSSLSNIGFGDKL